MPPKSGRTRRADRSQTHTAGTFLRAAAVVALALVAAAMTLQVSLAGVFGVKNPQLALRAMPADAAARAKLAERMVESGEPQLLPRARIIAVDALERDPLQAGAIRVLGKVDVQGRSRAEAATLPFMNYAQRLSKRELSTQLWLIDYYSKRGDRARAIQQVDLAMRASESSRARLFPLLDAMSVDAQSASLLLETLRTKPNWAHAFAVFMIDGGRNLRFAVRVSKLYMNAADLEDRGKLLHLLHRLTDEGSFALAWATYTDPTLRLSRNRDSFFRNLGFEAPEDQSPFDWTYAQEPDLWAARQKLVDGNTVLEVAAANGNAGVVAKQILRLAPGTYRLTFRAGNFPPAAQDRPSLEVSCARGGDTALGASGAAAVDQPSASREFRFSIRSNCAFQQLSIRAAGADALPDAIPWIDDIQIVPLR